MIYDCVKQLYSGCRPHPLSVTPSDFLFCFLIRQIGENLIVPSGVKTVDAYGQLVIPGGVDANTNLLTPQKGLNPADDFYHGTRAAVSGGTTTISQITNSLINTDQSG